jgi:hypothetical protein
MLFWRWRDLRLYSHVAIGIAVMALVVVDSTVAGVRGGDSPSPGPSIGGHQTVGRLIGRGSYADAVTSGHGEIWSLDCARSPRGAGRRCFVAEIDPTDGTEVTSVQVPAPASSLFYGAGRVWLSGGPRLTAIDPRSGAVTSELLSGGTIRSMAFRGPRAYGAVVGRDEVLEITPGKRLQIKVIEEHGGPLVVTALRNAIEVSNAEMNLVPVIFPGTNTTFLAALQLGRPVVAAAGPQAAWVRRGHQLVRETLGSDDRPARKYVATPGRPLRVLMNSDGGCHVSLASVPRSRVAMAYFSPIALSASHPTPTDVHAGRRVVDFALDPTGGVVYVDHSGTLRRWDPAA